MNRGARRRRRGAESGAEGNARSSRTFASLFSFLLHSFSKDREDESEKQASSVLVLALRSRGSKVTSFFQLSPTRRTTPTKVRMRDFYGHCRFEATNYDC
jgi:hypothetical protein